ncbi:hypothetical protein LSH36_107g00007 [Paralvinella palmiformis]|uniref:CUB domain-containing protein n=1 Tax=Paralvinella palmiformis TaxID=53620 RepID=A0AAD9K052_9ANNE|nr:hypothetical protein LSH36_107g00007 [Paralvinella palmiformis]
MLSVIKSHYSAAVTVVTMLSLSVTQGKITEDVAIPSNYCDVSNIEVDAVHIYNIADELRRSCSITMKADLEHFMIGFSHKVFDCNSPRSDYLFTPGEYLTMIFEKPLGKQKYNFSIVVTSYESGFFCNSDQMYCMYKGREMCIDDDVRCDGVKNCPDAKDEELCSKPRCFGSCRFSNDVTEFESSNKGAISMGILITIILLAALGVVGIVTLIVCCCRRQRRNAGLVIRHPQQPVTQQSVQSAAPASSPLIYYPTGTQPPSAPLPPPVGSQLATHPGYQPMAPPGAVLGGYQQLPSSYPQGPPSAGETGPPPAPYNPDYGPPTQPPPYSTQAVASAPPMGQ